MQTKIMKKINSTFIALRCIGSVFWQKSIVKINCAVVFWSQDVTNKIQVKRMNLMEQY